MRIGTVATRLGDVDGVSFETLKWHSVLTEMGHEIAQCAGALGDTGGPRDRVIPEMHLAHPPSVEVTTAAFEPASDGALVRAELERLVAELRPLIESWIDEEGIEALVVQNAWAIPMHFPLAVALARIVRERSLPAIAHNHDYWWERERFAASVVPDILGEAFPPDLPTVRHVSINSPAAAELRARRGIESMVVPNVFDFSQPFPEGSVADAQRLRYELGLYERDTLFVQPTRVVPRKGIELAIELVARLGQPNSVLLITSPAGDEGHAYLDSLLDLAASRNVELLYQPGRFHASTAAEPSAAAHSLADAYLAADVITYPSLYEGFGNALVEAIYFRKLTVVNRYAVYEADIRPLGLRLVELDGEVTDEAVGQLRAALADPEQRAADAEHNFNVGAQHLGFPRLRAALSDLLSSFG